MKLEKWGKKRKREKKRGVAKNSCQEANLAGHGVIEGVLVGSGIIYWEMGPHFLDSYAVLPPSFTLVNAEITCTTSR